MSETSRRILDHPNFYSSDAINLAREVTALEEQARRHQRDYRCEHCDSELKELRLRERALLEENARLRASERSAAELDAVKLALQKSNDDMGGGTVAEIVARVVKERDELVNDQLATRGEAAEGIFNGWQHTAGNCEQRFSSGKCRRRAGHDGPHAVSKLDAARLDGASVTSETLTYALQENAALHAQVTAVQIRCTELLEEKRRANVDYAVREFHLKFNQPAPAELGVPSDGVVRFRARLMTEEYLELLDAMFGPVRERPWWFKDIGERLAWYIETAPVEVDLVKWAHETHDVDYVVAGTRVAFGYNGLPGAAEVHRANLSKGPNDENGKPTKPPGWTPPDIAGILKAQGWKP